jgi:hypothetical protein
MAMPAAATIITAANTQAGTFSSGQAKTRVAVATSAKRTAGWSAGQKNTSSSCPPLSRLAVIHFCEENAEIIVMSIHDFSLAYFCDFERSYGELVMKRRNYNLYLLVTEV